MPTILLSALALEGLAAELIIALTTMARGEGLVHIRKYPILHLLRPEPRLQRCGLALVALVVLILMVLPVEIHGLMERH